MFYWRHLLASLRHVRVCRFVCDTGCHVYCNVHYGLISDQAQITAAEIHREKLAILPRPFFLEALRYNVFFTKLLNEFTFFPTTCLLCLFQLLSCVGGNSSPCSTYSQLLLQISFHLHSRFSSFSHFLGISTSFSSKHQALLPNKTPVNNSFPFQKEFFYHVYHLSSLLNCHHPDHILALTANRHHPVVIILSLKHNHPNMLSLQLC